MTPSGVYLDADGLAEIDLGNGNNYNPQEALNMYFQTGSIIGRSLNVEGDQNAGRIPIQELPGSGGGQVQVLIGAYNQYIQMMRDVTGLNEARDGSDPDPNSLVGVQKLAAANSNVATRHILYSSMFITTSLAENKDTGGSATITITSTQASDGAEAFFSVLCKGQVNVNAAWFIDLELTTLQVGNAGGRIENPIFFNLNPLEIEHANLSNNEFMIYNLA